MPPSTFQAIPTQDSVVSLPGGTKIRAFRRTPADFFRDLEKFCLDAKIGKIHSLDVSDDNGYTTLVVAYTEKVDEDQMLALLNDTVGLVCDLAEVVKELQKNLLPVRPPVSSVSEKGETVPSA